MTLAANMRKRKETDHNWSYGGHDLEDLNRCIRVLYDSSVRSVPFQRNLILSYITWQLRLRYV